MNESSFEKRSEFDWSFIDNKSFYFSNEDDNFNYLVTLCTIFTFTFILEVSNISDSKYDNKSS